jgi:predicted DNA-binding protein
MRIRRFSKPLTISLHPETFSRIKEITDTEARSMADWIREVVDQALNRKNAEQADVTGQSSVNGGK